MAKYTSAVKTARWNLIVGLWGSASIEVYNGTVPATANTALSGQTNLAAALKFGALGTVSGGVLTLGSMDVGPLVLASGTPTFVRIVDSSTPTTCYAQFTAGVNSGEWSFDGPLVLGDVLVFSGITFTDG